MIQLVLRTFSDLFGSLNTTLSTVSTEVAATPSNWNGSIYSMMKNISNTAVLPIAGVILTYVMTYELMQMLMERNAGNEIGYEMIFKWLLKTVIAIELVTHTSDIVLGVFSLTQKAIHEAVGLVKTEVTLQQDFTSLEASLETMEIADLIILFIQIGLMFFVINIVNMIIIVIIYGRMIEIYIYSAIGPAPLATFTNKDFGSIGQNYLKSIIALGLQGLIILICVAIYAALIQSITAGDDIIVNLKQYLLYTILLAFMLFKTGGLAKSIMNAS